MEKKKFVGFGEMMVRLAPAGVLRFPQAENYLILYLEWIIMWHWRLEQLLFLPIHLWAVLWLYV